MANRLKLNFQLETVEERQQFLQTYLKNPQFTDYPLTQKEISQISDYLLWGKDSTGKPIGKDLQLETKNKTWDKTYQIESLEELKEQINFNENSIHPIGDLSVQTKVKKESFSRSRARKEAPPHILEELEKLWNQIDETDLIINFYELIDGKKKTPIRKSLLERFDSKELRYFCGIAQSLKPYDYLKKKHLLVELRRQQFTFKDFYSFKIGVKNGYKGGIFEEEGELKVYPFGIKSKDEVGKALFTREVNPKDFSENLLSQISKIYWGEKKQREKSLKNRGDEINFDFRKLEDVYQLLQFYSEIYDENLKNLEKSSLKSELGGLLEALFYYIDLAELTAPQQLILERKIQKFSNEEIRKEINQKFQKTYTTNYISTIYRQKIIKKINEAAVFHEKIVENFFYPENFKKCSRCGRLFLIDSRNFIRKRTSKDGFNPRCKFCDRIKREERKLKKNKEN